jgi:hypothetical protein
MLKGPARSFQEAGLLLLAGVAALNIPALVFLHCPAGDAQAFRDFSWPLVKGEEGPEAAILQAEGPADQVAEG